MENAKPSRKNERRKLSDLALDVLRMVVIVIAAIEIVWIYGWRG